MSLDPSFMGAVQADQFGICVTQHPEEGRVVPGARYVKVPRWTLEPLPVVELVCHEPASQRALQQDRFSPNWICQAELVVDSLGKSPARTTRKSKQKTGGRAAPKRREEEQEQPKQSQTPQSDTQSPPQPQWQPPLVLERGPPPSPEEIQQILQKALQDDGGERPAPGERLSRPTSTPSWTSSVHKAQVSPIPEDKDFHAYFVFNNISIHNVGRFRLKFTLFVTYNHRGEYFMDPVATCMSGQFVGIAPSSKHKHKVSSLFSRALAGAGLRVKLRSETKSVKVARTDWSAPVHEALGQRPELAPHAGVVAMSNSSGSRHDIGSDIGHLVETAHRPLQALDSQTLATHAFNWPGPPAMLSTRPSLSGSTGSPTVYEFRGLPPGFLPQNMAHMNMASGMHHHTSGTTPQTSGMNQQTPMSTSLTTPTYLGPAQGSSMQPQPYAQSFGRTSHEYTFRPQLQFGGGAQAQGYAHMSHANDGRAGNGYQDDSLPMQGNMPPYLFLPNRNNLATYSPYTSYPPSSLPYSNSQPTLHPLHTAWPSQPYTGPEENVPGHGTQNNG